jgi:hypothetical protein
MISWMGEVNGQVKPVAQTEDLEPGAADLARNIAGRKFPGATIGRVWPDGDQRWWNIVYPGEVMPLVLPAGVAGYEVVYRTEAFETVGTVYHGAERVGNFYVSRRGTVSVGRSRRTVASPSVALLSIVRAHQESVRSIDTARVAFGCPV